VISPDILDNGGHDDIRSMRNMTFPAAASRAMELAVERLDP